MWRTCVPHSTGPTHRYLGASAGCWKLFGDVLAKEYQDQSYWQVHRLTVDTYAVQHPGVDGPQTRQSLVVHLVALCAVFEHHVPLDSVTKRMGAGKMKIMRDSFDWLSPLPTFEVTILDVVPARSATEHEAVVRTWAQSTWLAWSDHHTYINAIFAQLNFGYTS